MAKRHRSLTGRDQRERELRAELDAHLDLETRDYINRGLSPHAARIAAHRSLGSIPAIQDDVRDVWRWTRFGQFWQDVRYAIRMLRRSALWTATALLALALGVGANTAIFSLADALLLRPLPVRDPGQLLTIGTASAENAAEGVSYLDFSDLREHATSLENVIAYRLTMVGVAATEESLPQMRMAMAVSRGFFQALGVVPEYGRAFADEESETIGRDSVAILSHDLWKGAFAADPAVVGRTITVSQRRVTIIGIAPESFTGMHPIMRPALYVPLTLTLQGGPDADDPMRLRGMRTFVVKARVRDGATRAGAQAELQRIATSLADMYPETNARRSFVVRSELEARAVETPQLVALVGVLGGLTLLVLVIACANVANLLLARGPARSREMAIRLSIGSGQFRLVRQLLTESAVLALLGGVLGTVIAMIVARYLRTISLPTDIPLVLNTRLDGRALLVSLFASASSAIVFGIIPAWRAAKADLVSTLKRHDSATAGGSALGTRALVIAQIALSLALVSASAFLLEAFRRAATADPGIRTDHIMMIELDPGLARYSTEEAQQFYQQLKERVSGLAMVRSATLARGIPFRPNFTDETVVVEGYVPPQGREGDRLPTNVVDEQYFDTMQVPILRGRGFTADDRPERRLVVVVNAAFVERYWPGQDAIGRRLRFGAHGPWLDVVGVARTGKYLFLGEPPQPYIYLPLSQNPRSRLTLLVETKDAPLVVAEPLRQIVRDLDPRVPVYNARPLDQFFADGVLGTQALILQIVAAMGTVGLSLALIGLYAVVAYSAGRRVREFAIRVAVGATRGNVVRLVLRDGALVSTIGILVGVMLSVPIQRLLSGALIGLGPLSPWVFVIVPATVLMLTITACVLPAWRSSLVEPTAVLRLE